MSTTKTAAARESASTKVVTAGFEKEKGRHVL